jgi:hypothetical protein
MLGAACTPARTAVPTSNPYALTPFDVSPCTGKEVLRVENNLRESVEIVRLTRGDPVRTAHPVSVALLSPGAHSLVLAPEPNQYFAARTAGSDRYISDTQGGKASQSADVRLDVQCRASA